MAASPPPPTTIRRNPPRRGRPPPTPATPPPPTTIRRNPPRRARPPPTPTPARSAKPKPPPLSRLLDEAAAATAGGISALPPLPPTLPTDAGISPIPPPHPNPAATAQSQSAEERLKVYLRIRPLPAPERELCRRPKAKEQQSRKPPRQDGDGVCLVATGPNCVALTVPQSKFVDHKRGRTEVFDGFSAVLPPDSSQHDIFTQVMNPLVDEFLGGKSGLLVAMGPTGSGKRHTVFGTARHPGIVPLTLHKIFNTTDSDDGNQPTRSFCLSMFEILCEGKAERILDLLSDAADLVLQQSTIIKGLKEVAISNFMDAESLISCGMLKRSTAPTDANSESSRSQCIIIIRAIHKNNDLQSEHQIGGSVLTIADLAGAERKKNTGNMGSRLLESNFINNTSMVFGNCLRALLDYQKNQKKTLEKHFKNSMLTRYLRDYLEGRKKMTLILNVKPGDDDYSDTSYLLRQASPYTKIRYTSLDDTSDLASQKRSSASLICQENKKRRKVHKPEVLTAEGKGNVDKYDGTKLSERDENFNSELQRVPRGEQIMKNLFRALWAVSKQKLLESENAAKGMKELLSEKDTQIIELKKELNDLKSCSHEKFPVVEDTPFEQNDDCPTSSEEANSGNFGLGVLLGVVPKNPEELESVSGSEPTVEKISAEYGTAYRQLPDLTNDRKCVFPHVLNERPSCLTESYQTLKDEITDMTDKSESLSKEHHSLIGKCKALEDENGTVLAECMMLEHLSLFLRGHNDEVASALVSLTDETALLSLAKGKLDSEVQVLSARSMMLESENSNLKKHLVYLIEVLRTGLVLLEFELNTRKCVSQELAIELESCMAQLLQKDDELLEVEENVQLMQDKIRELCGVVGALQVAIEGAKVVKGELKKKIVILTEEVTAKDEEIFQLRQANETLQVDACILRKKSPHELMSKEFEQHEIEFALLLGDGIASSIKAAVYEEKALKFMMEAKAIDISTIAQKQMKALTGAAQKNPEDPVDKKLDNSESFSEQTSAHDSGVTHATSHLDYPSDLSFTEHYILPFIKSEHASLSPHGCRKEAPMEQSKEELSRLEDSEHAVDLKEVKHHDCSSSSQEGNSGTEDICSSQAFVDLPGMRTLHSPSLSKDCRQVEETTDEKENCPAKVVNDKKEDRQAGVTDKEEDLSASKPSKTKKSTRRLLPTSAMMLKEFTGPDMEAATDTKRVADAGVKASGEAAAGRRSEKLIRLLKARPVTKHHHRS